MIQAAATFGAGIVAGQTLNTCKENLPSCAIRGHSEQSVSFKLSVHVHGASAPELSEPGIVARSQPRLEVLLGTSRKESEVADFFSSKAVEGVASCNNCNTDTNDDLAKAAICECPWRFGDTLTFSAQLQDLTGVGLRLRLSARSDVSLGPLQLQMPQVHELGEAVLNLRRQVLPACEPIACQGGSFGGSGRPEWKTPCLVVPLTRVRDMAVGVVGRVVVSISVNAEPKSLMKFANELDAPLVSKMVQPFIQCMQAPVDCVQMSTSWLPLCSAACAQGSSKATRECKSPKSSPQRCLFRGDETESEMPPSYPSAIAKTALASYTNCEVPTAMALGTRLSAAAPSQAFFGDSSPSQPSATHQWYGQLPTQHRYDEKHPEGYTPRQLNGTRSATDDVVAPIAEVGPERCCTSGVRMGGVVQRGWTPRRSMLRPPFHNNWNGATQRGFEHRQPVLASPVRGYAGAHLYPYVAMPGRPADQRQPVCGYA